MATEIPTLETDLWCLDNAVDRATAILATSTTGALGAENIRDPRRSKPWRPLDDGSTLTIRLAAPTAIDVLGLWGTFAKGATFRVELGTTLGGTEGGSFVWAPPVAEGVGQALLVWGRTTTIAAGEITASDFTDSGFVVADTAAPFTGPESTSRSTPTNWSGPARTTVAAEPTLTADLTEPPSVIEIRITASGAETIGRVWAGPVFWRPAVPHRTGSAQSVEDTSLIQRNPRDGGTFIDRGRRLRRHEVSYEMLTPEEYDGAALHLAMVAGTSRQMVFVPNPMVYQPTRHALLCHQEAINPISASGFERWERGYALMEAG